MTIAQKPTSVKAVPWCCIVALWAPPAAAAQGVQTAPAVQVGHQTQSAPAEAPQTAPSTATGGEAIALADRLAQAHGGWQAYRELRYLRFAFVVERDGEERLVREHLWDKHRGRARVEWKDKEGQACVAVLDLGTRSGDAVRNATLRDETEREQLLEQAYGYWVNDSYWLVMPFKTRDLGVRLTVEGSEEIDGRIFTKLGLSFESVGLTPGDRYWVSIDEQSGRMERWAYILEGREPPPVVWRWRGWQRVGGIELSTEKVREDGTTIRMRDLSAPSSVPQGVLTDPRIALP